MPWIKTGYNARSYSSTSNSSSVIVITPMASAPFAQIDVSRRILIINVTVLNSRLPRSDRVSATDRRHTFQLALHQRAPLNINEIRLLHHQELQALRIQGTGTTRQSACDRCQNVGDKIKLLFRFCRSIGSIASGACANCVYTHRPQECSLYDGMCTN